METLPVGRFKFVALDKVPDWYLEWLIAQFSFETYYERFGIDSMEKLRSAILREYQSRHPPTEEVPPQAITLQFGKFKGTKIKDLPDSYIGWLVKSFDFGGDERLRRAVFDEHDNRQARSRVTQSEIRSRFAEILAEMDS